jgi:hypothetical protein
MILAVLGLGTARSAQAATINFDDIPTPLFDTAAAITNPYQGFTWTNFFAFDPDTNLFAGSGYENGIVSPGTAACNCTGVAASFSAAAPFSFDSTYISAAWRDGMTVRILGRLLGSTVYDQSIIVNHTGPNLVVFNWLGIDEVQFASSGGAKASGLNFDGAQFVIDNVSVNSAAAVPEPSTWLLLGSGVALLTARRLKKTA